MDDNNRVQNPSLAFRVCLRTVQSGARKKASCSNTAAALAAPSSTTTAVLPTSSSNPQFDEDPLFPKFFPVSKSNSSLLLLFTCFRIVAGGAVVVIVEPSLTHSLDSCKCVHTASQPAIYGGRRREEIGSGQMSLKV